LGRRHVVPVAAAFLEAYPEVVLRLRLSDRVINLQEEHIDIAVRIGALPDSSLIARQIGSVRLVVCASPAYLEKNGRPDGPHDLSAHDCISFAGLMDPEAWAFPIGGTVARVAVRSRLVVDAGEAVLDAGIAGAGIIRLYSYHVADAVRDGKLTLLLDGFEPAPLPVSIVYLGGALQPLKVRAFVDFATPHLRARLAADLR
jgi:DNA-binding transcriptional LysR family regulator